MCGDFLLNIKYLKNFVIDLLQPTYDRLEWKFDIDDTNEMLLFSKFYKKTI